MPYQVANTFNPMTPWGEGIQNITRALFSGPTPMEQESAAAQAEARRLQAEHYRAQNESLRAKTAAEAQARLDMQNAPRRLAGALLGNQAVADQYINARDGVKTDQYRGSDGEDGPLTAMAPTPMPQLDPNMAARVARLLTGVEAAKALPGNDNLGALAKFLPALMGDELRQGAIGGAPLKPEQYGNIGRTQAAMEGKPLFHDGGNGGMDNFSGQLVDPRLFNAKVGSENAQINQRNAAAGASSAHAGLYRAQTEDVNTSRAMVPALDSTGAPILDSTGKPVMIQQKERGAILMRGDQARANQDNKDANRDPKTNKFRPPNPSVVQAEIDRVLDVQRDKSGKVDPDRSNQLPLDAATQARVRDRAIEFYKDSGNMAQAVQDALGEVGELKRATEPGRIYGTNELPYRTPANTLPPRAAPNPNARQIAPPQAAPTDIPPPQARVKNQVYQTPKGPMRWTGTGWVMAAPGADS